MHADYTAGILSRTGLTRMPSAPTSTRNTPHPTVAGTRLRNSFQYAPECPNTAFTVFNAMSKSEIIDQFST